MLDTSSNYVGYVELTKRTNKKMKNTINTARPNTRRFRASQPDTTRFRTARPNRTRFRASQADTLSHTSVRKGASCYVHPFARHNRTRFRTAILRGHAFAHPKLTRFRASQ